MNKLSRTLLLFLSSPLRYSVRYELSHGQPLRRKQALRVAKDIGIALQRRATESTAIYVERHMRNVDSVSTKMNLLAKAMKEADLENGQLICEFGVYSGLTVNHIASLTKLTVYGFDSFEGLPERWRDGFGKARFRVSALPKVKPNVTLVKGWFDETLPAFIREHDQPMGLIHIDCDLYSSTKTVFDALSDRIHPGCIIVFDEYFNYPGWEDGEYRAFREFIERTGLSYEYIGYNRTYEQVAVRITGS